MSGYTCWQFGKNCVSCLSDVEGFGRKRTARNGNRQERTSTSFSSQHSRLHLTGGPHNAIYIETAKHMLNMCLALRRQARCRARARNFILRMCNTLLVQSATHAARARASVQLCQITHTPIALLAPERTIQARDGDVLTGKEKSSVLFVFIPILL